MAARDPRPSYQALAVELLDCELVETAGDDQAEAEAEDDDAVTGVVLWFDAGDHRPALRLALPIDEAAYLAERIRRVIESSD